jgi:hypothetical protein
VSDPDLDVHETEFACSKAAPVDDARKLLQESLEELIEQALSWHELCSKLSSIEHSDAPHHAIRITTGIGKSEQIRRTLAVRFIPEAKRRKLPHRVLYLVSTHKLAGEARSRMPDGVVTAIWQGRDGIKLGTDEPMCANHEAVEAALKIGAEVEETACKRKEARCPFYDTCHYQAQKALAGKADVVLAAHEILFQVPNALGKNFGLVVVDEGFWQDGIVDTRLVIAGLAHELQEFPVRGYDGAKLDIETAHLRDLI